jgi:RNA polymerase sigma-32 factor
LASKALEDNEQARLFQKALEEFREDLEERELVFLEERLLSENPKTLLELGERFGFSKERARQVEERIKSKLKSFLETHYPDIAVD